MIEKIILTIKENMVLIAIIFIFGNTIGSVSSYFIIAKDCKVLGMFRIGEVAFDCHLYKK